MSSVSIENNDSAELFLGERLRRVYVEDLTQAEEGVVVR
jgi:hypothetical protein